MDRIKQLAGHLSSSKGRDALLRNGPDDVVIVFARRSPLTKSRKGGFKDTNSSELLTSMFKATIEHSGVDPKLIQDICVGTVLPKGPTYEARSAALAAGIPQEVPIQTINRFCSSGLMAVANIANAIRAGQIDIGLAVGVESMSANPDEGAHRLSDDIMNHPIARDNIQPMGWTSENVAADFNVTRERMDAFAAASFQRAERAQALGYFDKEIVPLEGFAKDPTTGERKRIIVSRDDGIRPGTTAEGLGKIRPAFPQWGHGRTTGGNASQITDGAAAVLLMTRRRAEQLGVPILAKFVTMSVVGLAPRIMGIGPAYAIPNVLAATGLSKDDVDLFEINEAFASMAVYCVQKLGLDHEKVNVNGGAIALGHPLDTHPRAYSSRPLRATGARQIATGLAELERRDKKILVTSMCVGTGMGAAAVFVRE
ncbi:thiolase [Exidia glandulosa HHB12029]|uniref:Thiolase n=1 Tax=Exidia glandulosa HHB12029 TaxID=1314781 RepID=A0A165IRE8_EXIGL|nr:thiolase [Exidia glandulosa HHB12029]